MRASILVLKLLLTVQKFSPVQKMLARQFRKPDGILGRMAIEFMAVANQQVYRWVLQFSCIGERDAFLEIGFGHGNFLRKLAEEMPLLHISGIDFSADMVRRGQRLYRHLIEKGRLQLELGASDRMPFSDASFNRVLAVNVVYFWASPENDLREIRRVLRPGSRAVFYLTDKASLQRLVFPQQSVFRQYEAEQFKTIVEKAGFAKVEVFTKDFQFKSMTVSGICIVAHK